MAPSARPAPLAVRLRSAFPPVLVLAGALGYIGVDLWVEELPDSVPDTLSPWVHSALVVLQAAALIQRNRRPTVVFGVVVLLDLVILATTAGELGIGALGVLFASYAVARHQPRRTAWITLGTGAAATTIVGGVAMALGSAEPPLVLLFTAVARIALLYGVPAGVAEYTRGRERLLIAIEDQARMADNERRVRALIDLRAERTALARELHDIAGHHLSGIIVSAQAANALMTSDPERARAMLQAVQEDARTTLVDLRRTVGLLRSDDPEDHLSPDGQPVTPSAVSSSSVPPLNPTIAAIPELVRAAQRRGQRVELVSTGDARTLGPLAETAAYRMVQESLANAARHAPGAACRVIVRFAPEAIDLIVSNERALRPAVSAVPTPSHDGYGLWGMRERAELIGARLETAPTSDGGWLNHLEITDDGGTRA